MAHARRYPSVLTITAAAVGIGLLPMPFEYYVLLRFLLFGVSIWMLTQAAGVSDVERWLLAALAVLFNPIAPLDLGRGAVWAIVHLGAVGYFWTLNRRLTRLSRW